MLKYIVILLDDTATSFCYYSNNSKHRIISLSNLEKGIKFAMRHNLMMQFVYPKEKIPLEYEELILSVEHTKIQPINSENEDVVVIDNSIETIVNFNHLKNKVIVLKISKDKLFGHSNKIIELMQIASRINLIISDIDLFTETDFQNYRKILLVLATSVKLSITNSKDIQINLITDRIILSSMNNCNAGAESITLSPNGKFYVCPGFYYDNESDNIGDLEIGLNEYNSQLFQIRNAPICKNCDAYQCKRCVWLNKKQTLEVNTPSYEQCICSHIEREASRILLEDIEVSAYYKNRSICQIGYLDPFELIQQ